MPRPLQLCARWVRHIDACIDKLSRRHKSIQLETVPSIAHSLRMPQRVVVAIRNWRILMISFIPGKTLGGRVVLISAGILLHANGALAAAFAGAPQLKGSALPSGTARGRAKLVVASVCSHRL